MKTTYKFSVLASLIFLLAIAGCRKKIELEKEVATKPAHCYNSIMDEDETVVDMGGSCGTEGVQALESNCGVGDTTVTIDAVNKAITSCTKTVNGSGEYVFSITYAGGGTLTVTTRNDVRYNYDLSMVPWTPDDDECKVYIGAPYYTSITTGQTQVKFNGIDYAISICNGAIYYGFGSTASIKLFTTVN
ncbi:MAG: hypothetical protein K0S44_2396 [Bacteroidetes bacterium]|jgi:hypothetical protein|nr:hypothetical protein [Bacteroidota bacterium]